MRLVVVESPFAGHGPWPIGTVGRWRNVWYARACIRGCLLRGESPIASHLLYPQAGVLDDKIPTKRKLGMDAGHAWMGAADAVVVYMDRGMSGGMQAGIIKAKTLNKVIEYRYLYGRSLTSAP